MKRYFAFCFFMVAAPVYAQEGDPAAGEQLFGQCSGCHMLEEGQNRAGPHLFGVVGREIGSVEGFRYTGALADSTEVWDEASLIAYLTAPREAMPGTRKTVFLRSEEDAANLVAYLRSLGG